jgi:NADPH:quinone reductase-like Zn-dependent oxidoreductase
MRAVVYEKNGKSGFLHLSEVSVPSIKNGNVLIRVVASSVNAVDYRPLQMNFPFPNDKIFGADVAGRVVAVGKNVHTFHLGDDVFGDLSGCGSGAFAEYVSVPEKVLALKPSRVSFEQAAALPVAALTALQGLRNIGGIQKGQKVLINGSGGGVGTYAVQLAKYYGAEVTAVCSAQNAKTARSLGADFVIDYTTANFTENGSKYDLILVVNGNYPLSAYRRVLTLNGVCVMVGGALREIIKSVIFGPLMSLGKQKFRTLYGKPNALDLQFVINLVESGQLQAVIDRRYPLNETPDALRYLGEGHAKGKVSISVCEETDLVRNSIIER